MSISSNPFEKFMYPQTIPQFDEISVVSDITDDTSYTSRRSENTQGVKNLHGSKYFYQDSVSSSQQKRFEQDEMDVSRKMYDLNLQYEELTKRKALIEDAKKREKEPKRKKQNIPKNVRIIVWNHYIGQYIIQHRCLCCKKVLITNTNFEVGHVISEKNGGTHEINNLRPICFSCNHSMGSGNMIDFVVKYGLYIG
jgi:5-methylcytosine-specific restriction endonuclease McrA